MGNTLNSYGYGTRVPIEPSATINTDTILNACNTNIRNLFLSESNIQVLLSLANSLAKYHNVHHLPFLRKRLPELMTTWANKRQIERFEVDAGCVSDWFQNLEFLNRLFLDENYENLIAVSGLDEKNAYGQRSHLKANSSINADENLDVDFSARKVATDTLGEPVSGLHISVGTLNEFENTMEYRDVSRLQAVDYGTIDVWAPTAVYAWDRYPIGNKYSTTPEWHSGLKQYFPVQQTAGFPRRYDRSNEGLRDSKEHSERLTHLRPFDMSCFKDL